MRKSKIIPSKVPIFLKNHVTTASGGLVVFTGLHSAGPVMELLQSRSRLPISGYVIMRYGSRVYFCHYGFFEDPDIYSGS